MKKILITVLLLSIQMFLPAQNKISASIGYGYYFYNSENSMEIIGSKNFNSHFFFGFSYQRNNVLGLNLACEYNYHNILKDNVIDFIRTDADANQIAEFGADLTLINHNIDLDIVGFIDKNFSYGFGPSIVITNRIIEVEDPSADYPLNIYDKLASSGIGANAFFLLNVPLQQGENYFFFESKVKLRYTHSIWFDEGIRNLDNYSQDFFTYNVSAGIGYSF